MINTIIQGHAKTKLPDLPAESVNCVVTSPPYWGLRDYGVEPVTWDGDKDCKHDFDDVQRYNPTRGKRDGKGIYKDPKWEAKGSLKKEVKSNFCKICGAWRGSLGLEPTFELYIKHLCDIFDEVKRALRKDGTCWVNLGDSYIGGGGGNYGNGISTVCGKDKHLTNIANRPAFMKANKVQAKSLCLIPQRFAIEMVNRGWILRNTIFWHKPNCMPSSAKDRFTVDFEYVYFFVKSKKYWFEQQFEEHTTKDDLDRRKNKFWSENIADGGSGKQNKGRDRREFYGKQGRNKRAVWTIPTQPFPEAHFAVYPEALIELMIKAGCPRYVCKKCGKARVKIYKKIGTPKYTEEGNPEGINRSKMKWNDSHPNYNSRWWSDFKEIGYSDCGCNAGWESGIVLDPFMGAGTTALVALKQKKRFIGIEIKKEYIQMACKRISKVQQRIF